MIKGSMKRVRTSILYEYSGAVEVDHTDKRDVVLIRGEVGLA